MKAVESFFEFRRQSTNFSWVLVFENYPTKVGTLTLFVIVLTWLPRPFNAQQTRRFLGGMSHDRAQIADISPIQKLLRENLISRNDAGACGQQAAAPRQGHRAYHGHQQKNRSNLKRQQVSREQPRTD